jgi:hypothetical protein
MAKAVHSFPPEKKLVAMHEPSSSLTVGLPNATDVRRESRIGIENFILMVVVNGNLGNMVK